MTDLTPEISEMEPSSDTESPEVVESVSPVDSLAVEAPTKTETPLQAEATTKTETPKVFSAEKKNFKELGLPKFPKDKILNFLLNFLIPLISLAGCAILAFLVLIPSQEKVPGLKEEFSLKQALSSGLDKKVQILKDLVDLAPQVEQYALATEKALLSEPKVPELLAQIDLMVKESGMSVSSLNYSQSEKSPVSAATEGEGEGVIEEQRVFSPEPLVVNVSLSASGSMDSLIKFLKSVENASRLVVLKEFRYSYTAGKDGNLGELSANFQLESPYLFVSSSAITDEPIDLDITSRAFLEKIKKIENLHYYDVSKIDIPVPEAPAPAPEVPPPEVPVTEVLPESPDTVPNSIPSTP